MDLKLKCLKIGKLAKPDWSKNVLHCGFVRKGGTPPLPFTYNIVANKEWPLPQTSYLSFFSTNVLFGFNSSPYEST